MLPIFTLNFKANQILSTKQLHLKTVKKFKENQKKENEKLDTSEKEDELKDLYDADMDDLDSSDLGEHEKNQLKQKNTSEYDPGMQPNINSLRKALYQLSLLVMLLFFCSSLFAYLTRRELIFP